METLWAGREFQEVAVTDEELCTTLKSYGNEVPSKETLSKLAAASGKEPSEVGAIYVRIVRGPRLAHRQANHRFRAAGHQASLAIERRVI